MTTASDILKQGSVTDAIAAATETVKNNPKDLQHRWLLAELLIISGDLERAEKQFEALVTLDPRTAIASTPLRQLIRAESARRQCFDKGRVPELLDGANESLRAKLQLFVAVRAGDNATAAELTKQTEIVRPALPGKLRMAGDEVTFEDFRDLDDLTSDIFEVLTYTGKYYWIEMSRVSCIKFEAPTRPLDLIWRKAQMEVRDAFDAEVYLPAVYATLTNSDDESRLGRRTEWIENDGGAVRGVGRRCYAINGESDIDMMAIEQITF